MKQFPSNEAIIRLLITALLLIDVVVVLGTVAKHAWSILAG
jgi:hypothetical protein